MRTSKFTFLADKLTNEIFDGNLKHGDVIPTQYLLAKEYNISRSCVQKALNLLDDRGLIERKPGKGIYVKSHASHIREKKSIKSIAYLVNIEQKNEFSEYDNFGLEIIWGMEEKTRELNINFLLRRHATNDTANIISTIKDLNVDGVILHRDTNENTLRSISAYGMPAVIAGKAVHLPKIGAVALNIIDSYNMLLSRLQDCCIKKVLIMYSSGYIWSEDFEVLKHSVLKHDSMEIEFVDWFRPDIPINSLEEDASFKNIVFKTIKENKLPDVFICMSDWYAMKTITVLNENGIRVPDDTGVIGTLGLELAKNVSPSITSLAADSSVIGGQAVKMLYNMIDSKNSPVIERIPLSLIERDSFIFKD